MDITFLSARVPLTKRFVFAPSGEIETHAYPMVSKVTSHTEHPATLSDMAQAIASHAAVGRCLLKGNPSRPLIRESRRGTTASHDATGWVVLDFDSVQAQDHMDVLQALGLAQIAHIWQLSASYGIKPGIRGHVFMLLDTPVSAPLVKSWLQYLNLTTPMLYEHLGLSADGTSLRWPLDVTTCQNDKLIYIAPPTYVGKPDPYANQRVFIIQGPQAAISTEQIKQTPLGAIQKRMQDAIAQLREAKGLPPRRHRTKIVDTQEVTCNPDRCVVTGIYPGEEFIRLDLNGGDSRAYWHPVDNYDFIHSFKSDEVFLTKELVPGYYAEKLSQSVSTTTGTVDYYFGCRDRTSEVMYTGQYNPETKAFRLDPARRETHVRDFLVQFTGFAPKNLPIWDVFYDPSTNDIDDLVNIETQKINMWKPPALLLKRLRPGPFNTIKTLIAHMLGTDIDSDLYEHFINWFACLAQRQIKPQTAWILHGVPGTGKGLFVNRVAVPLLGESNVSRILTDALHEKYNEYMENKLLCFVDETNTADYAESGIISAKLKAFITEETITVRPMWGARHPVPNWCAFIMASNQSRPIPVEAGDRRYNVGEYQELRYQYPGDGVIENELEHFAYFIYNYAVDPEVAHTCADTKSRTQMIDLSQSAIDRALSHFRAGDFAWFKEMSPSVPTTVAGIAYKALIGEIERDKPDRISRDQLYTLLRFTALQDDMSPTKFTQVLGHHRVEVKPVNINNRTMRGLKVDWDFSQPIVQEEDEE